MRVRPLMITLALAIGFMAHPIEGMASEPFGQLKRFIKKLSSPAKKTRHKTVKHTRANKAARADKNKPKTKKNTRPSPAKAIVTSAPAATIAAATDASAEIPAAKAVNQENKTPPSKKPNKDRTALVSTLDPTDLLEFEQQPKRIQALIRSALKLTRMKLTYTYGSNSPKQGGMDCSGTIQYLLQSNGIRGVPRQANLIYNWLKKEGNLKVGRIVNKGDPKLKLLKPGDLLFWSGTYKISRKITHVMMYLGTDLNSGKPIMFGASSGRTYKRKKRHGVSVFDFRLPKPHKRSKFEGFGPIPNLEPELAKATP